MMRNFLKFEDDLKQKVSAALALQSYLNKNEVNKENDLQSLADSYPALTRGWLGGIFKLVCPTLESETPAKVDAPLRHAL